MEYGPEIVHVCQGRAGHDLVAERLEEPVRVVFGEALQRVDPKRPGPLQRIRPDDRPGHLLSPVDPSVSPAMA